MARSELNSLLDSAVEAERASERGHDDDEDLYRRFSLDELSDAELEAEIERRYQARQQAARTAHARTASSKSAPSSSGHSATGRTSASPSGAGRSASGARSSPNAPPRSPSSDQELRLAYAALEVPYGADFATVRKSYRQLMRKYHPDRHAGSPEKQKAATELAQKLSQAYELIEKRNR